MDIWENAKVISSLVQNLKSSRMLNSLVLCSVRLSNRTAKLLNQGILENTSLKSLRLNFMIYKTEILRELMPCLCESTSLLTIDLSANGLSENHSGMIARIIQEHQARKDEQKWLKSLRKVGSTDEIKLNTLKQLVLAYNEFRGTSVKMIASVIRNDDYMRAIDLRANLIEAEWIDELYSAFKDNETLFNVDLRENPGFQKRHARMFALKMLANYTKTGYEFQQENPLAWK